MFIKNLKNTIASIGRSIDKPVFIKEYRDQSHVIDTLDQMKSKFEDEDLIKSIELDQLLIKLGDVGEKNICFELENSMLPILCLHNVCLEYDGQRVQMDFVLITHKYIAVLESKKLSGDITVNADGQFTRSFKSKSGKVYKKEAIYSPITQNERHVTLLRKFLMDKNLIKHMPVISFVVLADPKSILNTRYAKKAVRNKILRCDQLIERLKFELDKKSEINMPITSMEEIAEILRDTHFEKEQAFISKYEALLEDEPVEEKDYYELLKSYRLKKSKELNYKAYMVFNNEQMQALIDAKPTSNEEILNIKGFGPKKVEVFGEEIIDIFKDG